MSFDLPAWVTRENVAIVFLFMATMALFAYLAWAAQRNPLLRLTDVMTGDNGRYASGKLLQVLAFGLTGWGMVYLTVTGTATPTEWTIFGGAWGGLALGSKFAPTTPKPPVIPPQDGQP